MYFLMSFLCALSLYLMKLRPDKQPQHNVYWVFECSIDFYILWLVRLVRAYILYAEESMTCLDRCTKSMILVRQRSELTGRWGDWWITLVKQRLGSREAPGPYAWLWNKKLTRGTIVMLLVQCEHCRAPVFFYMWVKTATRWSDSSNSLPVTQISACHWCNVTQTSLK